MLRVAALAVVALAVAACHDEPSCLRGACPLPCVQVTFACAAQPAPTLWVGRVADAPAALRLGHGAAGDGDTLISNGVVTAVFNSIDAPVDLAPTGGDLIDFGPAGGDDDLALTYQLAGILPDDAFAYRSITIDDRRPAAIGLTMRGALAGRPDVVVVTHYELLPCDAGLRVRSELFNGGARPEGFVLADASHWGKRRVVPFTPVPHQGYVQPPLDLLNLSTQWSPYDYVGGATPAPGASAYGAVACSQGQIAGVNDLELSALGTDLTLVRPGDTLSYERLLVTTAGRGTAGAVDAMLAASGQLFAASAPVHVHGRVVAGGVGFGGDVRRASVMVIAGAGDAARPVTAVVPAADGTFAADAPGGAPLVIELWSFGRKVAGATVGADGGVGDLAVDLPATVQLTVGRVVGAAPAVPIHALVVFHPADDATRAAVTGSLHGRLTSCAPWLGPPFGASPACNTVLVEPAGVDVEVPAGRYHVFATAGPAHTLATVDVTLTTGEITPIALDVSPIDLAPAGWLSADLHVHGRASFDSGLPDADRVRSFAAQGVDVIAATDHDEIGDYTATVAALHLDGQVAVMGGLETTQLIPWLAVPGEDLPKVIGHFNFWPLTAVPGAPRGGAPWDELLEPGALFDVMAPLVGDGGVMMLNHPWDLPSVGRDLGYLRAIDFDPRRPITADEVHNGALLRRPAGGHRNIDWSAIEIINGADNAQLQKSRILWHALLAQGFVTTGTGNSDSHALTDSQLGWGRNWVDAGTTVASFDPARFDAAVRDGKVVAGTGVVVTVEVGAPGASGARRGLGLAPYAGQPGDVLAIEVRAAPWVPVDEVRVVTSRGTKVIAAGAQLTHPADPLGAAGVVRYHAEVPLAGLVDRDDFVIVEAGLAYPLVGDLDGDGVVDTSDNNRDGVVDRADVLDPKDSYGPLVPPPDPAGDPSDPRYLVTRVVPGAWPEGFANPILIDLDGGGWTPPGIAP